MKDMLRSEVAQLLSSGQFDAEWYVRRYPDVLQTGLAPAEHYLWLGRRLGRRSKPARADDVLVHLHAFAPYGNESAPIADAFPSTKPTISKSAESTDQAPTSAPDDAVCDTPDVEIMVQALANWPGLDLVFICYQLGIEIQHDAYRIAERYYTEIKKRNIQPNALFDPEYYRYYNNISFRDDALFHYITKGAKLHLQTHPLFDTDWYLTHYPQAKDAPDLLVHYWECGYKEKFLPVNQEKVKILDPIRKVFFSDVFVQESNFDLLIYREFNSDLSHLSDEDLFAHYERVGKSEQRIANLSTLFRDSGLPGHCIPIDFNPAQYVSLHLDLEAEFGASPWNSIRHFVGCGLKEGRRYTFNQMGNVRPLTFNVNYDEAAALVEKTPLCVLVHLYYPEMWAELREYIANIDIDFDLYVNFVESTWTSAAIQQVREDYPMAHIKISPNEGRDIGGFFSLLRDIDFSHYVAFTLLHSKKSPHVTREYATMWKKSLLGAILGSSETVKQNLTAFLTDPEVGIVGSVQTRHLGLESNAEGMRKLFDIYGITPEHEECEYVSGTMMMVRSEVMQAVYVPLSNHQFVNGDNKGIEHHIDGQVEHSVERIFGNVMRQLGYRFLWR